MVRVNIDISVERFRHWDTTRKQYAVELGKYELMVGGASDDLWLHLPLNIAATE